MRRVKVYKNSNKTEMIGVANFHIWGNKVVECFGDISSQTVAIVEFTDGSVKEVYPDCIEFIDENAEPVEIASYSFEHNDGDQIWVDSIVFCKNPDWTYRKIFKSGWDGHVSESEITLDGIIKELAEVKKEIEIYKKNKYRGGYTIYKDLAE